MISQSAPTKAGADMEEIKFSQIRRGDIYYVDFGNQPGSVMHGFRPAMVIQNDTGNRHSPTLIVAAITTEIKKLRQPTHLMIGSRFGLTQVSMLLLEQIFTIDKESLAAYVGTADNEFLNSVDRALAVSVGIGPAVFNNKMRKAAPKRAAIKGGA